jgi:hypothetical protein
LQRYNLFRFLKGRFKENKKIMRIEEEEIEEEEIEEEEEE